MLYNWNDSNVLLTGGGSGIGKEITKQLIAKGATVIVATLLQSEIQQLEREIAQNHIFVGAFCPGITRTPIFEAMGLESDNQSKGSVSYISQKFSMDVVNVAKSAIQALEKKSIISLPGLNKFVPILGVLPDRFLARVMYKTVENRVAK